MLSDCSHCGRVREHLRQDLAICIFSIFLYFLMLFVIVVKSVVFHNSREQSVDSQRFSSSASRRRASPFPKRSRSMGCHTQSVAAGCSSAGAGAASFAAIFAVRRLVQAQLCRRLRSHFPLWVEETEKLKIQRPHWGEARKFFLLTIFFFGVVAPSKYDDHRRLAGH